jgi:ribosomal subunit interface protein
MPAPAPGSGDRAFAAIGKRRAAVPIAWEWRAADGRIRAGTSDAFRGMQVPLQISFRNMEASPAIEAEIRRKAAKLEAFSDRITSVRVVVETPHRQHRQGKHFHVRVDVRMPGRELVVSRDPAEHDAYEDVYVAIRDAFDAAKRQVEDQARVARGAVKTHEPPESGPTG